MSGAPERHILALESQDLPAGLERLQDEAEKAFAAGAKSLTIDLDRLEMLEAPVISALIAVLRLARERGGDVRLVASRPRLLGTLRVTALDRLFSVASAPIEPAAAPRRPKRVGVKTAATLSLLVLALVFVPGTRATAVEQKTPSPDDVMTHLTTLNPDMRSYQAHLRVDLQLRTFPYIAQHLEGTTYFKRPANYEVVFTKVPSYAKGFDKLYTDVGDPSSWERRFNMTVIGTRGFAGHSDVALRLVQKVRGMIDHEDVLVDPRAWHVDDMEWHYYNGGVISMSNEYAPVDGFSVIRAQHATIRIPFVHASAEGRYDDYHVNVPVDDSVFTKEQHK